MPIKWEQIQLSKNRTSFVYEGKSIFNQSFSFVMEFHPPGIAAVEDASGAYHIGCDGNEIYSQRYSRTFGYYFDRATIIKDNLWFHIDIQGKRLYSQNYKWCGNYQENLCTVKDFDNHYFHIDSSGNRIYEENYLYAGDFREGFSVVYLNSGMFIHIDQKGKQLNKKEFLDLGVFHKGYATAKDSRGWYHINLDGEELYSNRYLMIEPFYNGFAFAETFNKQKVIVNENGEELIIKS